MPTYVYKYFHTYHTHIITGKDLEMIKSRMLKRANTREVVIFLFLNFLVFL